MTVVAAVDGKELSSEVVTKANRIASGIDEELLVLHTMDRGQFEEIKEGPKSVGRGWDIPYTRYTKRDPDYKIEDARTDAADVAREIVEETLPSDTSFEVRGEVGDPAEVILDVAEEVDASFLVVGGRKRTPVGKALFGSVSQSLLLNANCPVVSVLEEE